MGNHRTLAAAAQPRRFCGRKPADNRKVLTGIVFVLKTGIPWEYLPARRSQRYLNDHRTKLRVDDSWIKLVV